MPAQDQDVKNFACDEVTGPGTAEESAIFLPCRRSHSGLGSATPETDDLLSRASAQKFFAQVFSWKMIDFPSFLRRRIIDEALEIILTAENFGSGEHCKAGQEGRALWHGKQ